MDESRNFHGDRGEEIGAASGPTCTWIQAKMREGRLTFDTAFFPTSKQALQIVQVLVKAHGFSAADLGITEPVVAGKE